jgi:isoquinoline 1-oxidoreductase alpha subunit
MEIHLNGEVRSVSAPADMPLLWVLREHLNLTGAKYGCSHGVCGGCMVSIDGAQAHACQTTLAEAAGKKIVTIEGQTGPIAEALFAAWLELDVAQCGFCQPAQITSAVVLLNHNPQPSDADIDEAMKHNLCRCATYQRVRKAIHMAANRVAATAKETA